MSNMHMSIPPELLLRGARLPTMIRELRPEDNIFLKIHSRTRGESTKSDHARQYCSHTKFHEIIRSYGERLGDDKCWFTMPTKSSSRLTHGYHRWHNKGPEKDKSKRGCTRRKFVLSHDTKPCTKDGYGFDLFEFTNPKETRAVYMMRRHVKPTPRNQPPAMLPPGHQPPVVDNEEIMPAQQVRSSDGYQANPFTQGILSDTNHTMQQMGAVANGNYHNINNGTASTGFSPSDNYCYASCGPLSELLPLSVFGVNNNESEVAHRNSTYLAGLSAVQGNQRADPSGMAGFTSLPVSNSLQMESMSAFSNIDYHAGPSGTAGDSFEAYCADSNY